MHGKKLAKRIRARMMVELLVDAMCITIFKMGIPDEGRVGPVDFPIRFLLIWSCGDN